MTKKRNKTYESVQEYNNYNKLIACKKKEEENATIFFLMRQCLLTVAPIIFYNFEYCEFLNR